MSIDSKAIDSKAIDSPTIGQPKPIAQQQNPKRIQHLDIIRGIALLGILLMNIQSFAMPSSAYVNPSSWGDFEGINYWYWAVTHLFADGKFINIFSILFGAGICLFTDSAATKGIHAIKLHYRRNFWLLLFGLIHAHLIWYGDILYSYAMCSFWVVLLRNATQKTLWIVALVLLLVSSMINASLAYAITEFPPEMYAEMLQFWKPTPEQHQLEIAAYTGSYYQQQHQRSMEALGLQTEVFFSYFIFRGSALMLIGMALFKSGFLSGAAFKNTSETVLSYSNSESVPESVIDSAQESAARTSALQTYRNMAILGIGTGIFLTAVGVFYSTQSSFSFNYALFSGPEWNAWGSIATALGYIAFIVIAIEKRWLYSLQMRLAAVGQMAFSHYIAQSVMATFIFYGWGLGLFAQVNRGLQLLVVITIWGLQLWISPIWLRRCHFGPLEWLWRSLTYWKWQPLLKKS
jgi:uncharacterized protein